MNKESDQKFSVYFTNEFNKCLDQIQAFFAEQGEDVLEWWFLKQDNMIDEIDHLLSSFPYAGKRVEEGPFKGLRRITYGKSRHRILNYLIFSMVYNDEYTLIVINLFISCYRRYR